MRPSAHSGYWLAIAAYVIWGLFPLYWSALDHVDAVEILAHRVVGSVVFVGILLLLIRQFSSVRRTLRQPGEAWRLGFSSLVISLNWGIYIWSVGHGQVLGASMGYYLSPLFSVLAGCIWFAERLRPLQWLAVVLAAVGVLNQFFAQASLPWVSLGVACSFAAYGVIRKAGRSDSLPGLFVETLYLAPFALAWMLWLSWRGQAAFLHVDWHSDVLLLLAGVVTAGPLLLYVGGARRLPLATMGMLFYLTPTIQFLFGVFWFDEPLTDSLLITFVLIWFALLCFTVEGRWQARIQRRARKRAEVVLSSVSEELR